jgi:hypothetical protein
VIRIYKRKRRCYSVHVCFRGGPKYRVEGVGRALKAGGLASRLLFCAEYGRIKMHEPAHLAIFGLFGAVYHIVAGLVEKVNRLQDLLPPAVLFVHKPPAEVHDIFPQLRVSFFFFLLG